MVKKKHAVVLVGILILAAILAILPREKKEAKVLFVGDMFFDRFIRLVGYNKGEDFTFSCINDFLKNSDLVMGNLEGPITNNPSSSLGTVPGGDGNYTFTFPARIAALLVKNNIRLVDLGNNHIGNFGQAGIVSTRKYLSEAKVNYFGGLSGDPSKAEVGEPIYRTELGGVKMSFISYNEFGGDLAEKVAQKIAAEKAKKQTVIVFTHWGDEYLAVPQRVKDMAKLFVKNGADLIVGSHPHIILPSQKIGDTWVYYSLGNFIFDQYWNKEVSTGLVLEVDIKGQAKDWKIVEHKVSLGRDGRTCLISDKN